MGGGGGGGGVAVCQLFSEGNLKWYARTVQDKKEKKKKKKRKKETHPRTEWDFFLNHVVS